VSPKRTGGDNIKMEFKETRREIVEWVHVVQIKGRRHSVVRNVKNIRVPYKEEKLPVIHMGVHFGATAPSEPWPPHSRGF
jgi:hypothetical protein